MAGQHGRNCWNWDLQLAEHEGPYLWLSGAVRCGACAVDNNNNVDVENEQEDVGRRGEVPGKGDTGALGGAWRSWG